MSTDTKNRNNEHKTQSTDILKRKPAPRPTVGIDVEYYQSIIDDPGVSEDRKRDLIAIIGRIVVQFIDIGFDVHPVQQAQETHADKTEHPKHITQTERERQKERIDA